MSKTIPTPFYVAALQLESFTASKLETYWKICDKEQVAFLLLGEYVIDSFFKTFAFNKEAFVEYNTEELLELSQKYDTALIAPIVRQMDNGLYKCLGVFAKGKLECYQAQRLIAFEHWDEQSFFANPIPKKIGTPFIIEHCGLKMAIIFGFEAYFDEIWLKLKNSNVDVVCVSSVATFGSHNRWREILKSRAFLNSCYILRANRIGEYASSDDESVWRFYGDSFFVSPYGEVESFLSDNEELLVAHIDPQVIMTHKQQWKFRV